MTSEYFSSLDYLAQKRYSEKLQVQGVSLPALPDPYVLGDEVWSEDMSLWPDLQYGDVYNYLIESKGIELKYIISTTICVGHRSLSGRAT